MTAAPFDHSTFSKNRERLMEHAVAQEFFQQVVGQARAARLTSSEHFTVDGTLIEAWASLKSFTEKDEAKRLKNAKKRQRKQRRGKGPKDGGGSNPEEATHACPRDHRPKSHRPALAAQFRLVATNVKQLILADTGHFVVDERPREVAQALRDFLVTDREHAGTPSLRRSLAPAPRTVVERSATIELILDLEPERLNALCKLERRRARIITNVKLEPECELDARPAWQWRPQRVGG